MDFDSVMGELSTLGNERIKSRYVGQGAKEPLFGVTIKNLKPLATKIKTDQALANRLFDTMNYDAMYLAGMIADSKNMSEGNFEDWMNKSYFYMLSDFTVSIVLAESPLAKELAQKWIDSGEELRASAGWCTYTWLLGVTPNSEFDVNEIESLLIKAKVRIHNAPIRERLSINSFIMAVGISYIPLSQRALQIAQEVGEVDGTISKKRCVAPSAKDYIEKAINDGRLGFKRKNVRC